MLLPGITKAQNSFELLGNLSNSNNSQFRLNGFESNVPNLTGIRDWEFSLTYGDEFSGSPKSNLYLISLSKRMNRHYFSFRYTPGYKKDFVFYTGTNINRGDTMSSQLKSQFHYEEKFGLGYSYRLHGNLTAGFTLRYFGQEFANDQASLRYDNSTTSIAIESKSESYNFWTGDLGFTYSPFGSLALSLSTINLLRVNEGMISEENRIYGMQMNKSLLLGLEYQASRYLRARLMYETENSFQAGLNLGADLFGGNLSLSAAVFHDRYQQPFLAGIIPGLNYSSKMFSVSLSGVRYFSGRIRQFSVSEFTREGLHNILNNRYSFDKAVLSVNFALNTIEEKLVRFTDVRIIQDIYPTLADNYLDNAFAVARVVNLSSKAISVKPSSMISGLNSEIVQSPPVTIAPNDTADVPFYTIINASARAPEKAGISQASFYLTTENSAPDDEFKKPVLINDRHSWDGRVSSLRYFVWKDFDFSITYAKSILQQHKQMLDTLPQQLTNFYNTKILFNEFVGNMIYVADPRASVNRVQFPNETIRLKGGACDDLSVSFSSLLESVGIQTAFVDFKSDSGMSHVNLLINTGLAPEMASLITRNDKKYILRKNTQGKDEVWIPLETTSLTNFEEAWDAAARKFNDEAIENLGLAKGEIQIVDIY